MLLQAEQPIKLQYSHQIKLFDNNFPIIMFIYLTFNQIIFQLENI
jgi:hypothetical protein